jgi:hypothetical protein
MALGLGVLLGFAAANLPMVWPSPATPKRNEPAMFPSDHPAPELARADGDPAARKPASASKPNIVFLLTDNLGYGELGCVSVKDRQGNTTHVERTLSVVAPKAVKEN